MKNKQVKQMIASVYSAKHACNVKWIASFHHTFLDRKDDNVLRGVSHDAPASLTAEQMGK